MTTLITGSTGLVGSALRKFYPNAVCVSSLDADLTNTEQALDLISKYKPTSVIHLASKVGGLFKNINDNVQMFNDNILINSNIVTACFKNNVQKFIGCLSTCVFPAEIEYPIHESMMYNGMPHESNFGYSYAKRMLDVHCKAINKQYNLNYKCIIPTNVYGPYDNFNLKDAHVIPALIHKAYIAKRDGTDFTVAGSGFPLRQFIYSADLAHLIFKLDHHEYDWVSPMIIADQKEYSIFETAHIIAEYFNVWERTGFNTNLPDGQHKKTVDNERLKRYITDFKFTKLKTGLTDTMDWFVENYDNARK
tara:strand:+ start:946 stop:1863 length:918 start_codon:yes stop_codon:yes gene_type:complete